MKEFWKIFVGNLLLTLKSVGLLLLVLAIIAAIAISMWLLMKAWLSDATTKPLAFIAMPIIVLIVVPLVFSIVEVVIKKNK